MKEAGSLLVVAGGAVLVIFVLQLLAAVIAPGLMVGYLYIAGTQKLFAWRDGSVGALFHVGVGLTLAVATIWFLFKATGLYKSYLA